MKGNFYYEGVIRKKCTKRSDSGINRTVTRFGDAMGGEILGISIKGESIAFFFSFLFRAAPTACRGSQAKGQIEAVATGPHHSNARSEPHL